MGKLFQNGFASATMEEVHQLILRCHCCKRDVNFSSQWDYSIEDRKNKLFISTVRLESLAPCAQFKNSVPWWEKIIYWAREPPST